MYSDSIEVVANLAYKKASFLKGSVIRYFVSSMLAGVYVGFGMVLIFTVGGPFASVQSPAVKLIMGVSFGVALTLVVFAGSELFTSNNMVMVIGKMQGKTGWADLASVWIVSYLGNLVGSLGLAYLMHVSGLMSFEPLNNLAAKVAATKMNAPMIELFVRAIFCNMLVCLAIWMSLRTQDDTAKIFLIFWALFAFIGSSFEHSVANMSLLGFPLMHGYDAGGTITWLGYGRNLLAVTLGNIVGGGIFIGAAYAYISQKKPG